TRLPQGGWPVLTQVHRDSDPVARGLGAVLVQRRRLEFQYPWLVELVHGDAAGPRQPPRPRVQTRREDHRLADAGIRRAEEELVEKGCAAGHIADHRLHLQLQAWFG